MAALARFFVSERYRRMIVGLIWLVVFVLTLSVVVSISVLNLRDTLRQESEDSLADLVRLRTNVLSTFEKMDEWLTAAPCSPAYLEQLRRVAYLPDGINEFLYARDGNIICSVNVGTLANPFPMGPPDISSANPYGISFWLDRDLGFLGSPGIVGTLVRRGAHVMIVPPEPMPSAYPSWMEQELVVRTRDDQWWHRGGAHGVFEAANRASGLWGLPQAGGYYHAECDPVGLHCVASRVELGSFVSSGLLGAIFLVLGSGVFAAMSTAILNGQLQRYWAFDARFRRHLKEGIECAYQPIISVRSGEIIGCEVLVRWRDLDGTLVYPDAFLDIVEEAGLTLALTHAVVEKGLREIQGRMKRDAFQVNFNIFPRDFSIETLDKVFPPDAPGLEDLKIVVELVETAQMPLATIQNAIAHLRERGISTYIDDFGVGYSNMQNLAMLDIDGVKIDRSFAMAPEDSIMARILGHAIEMAHESGRAIVIEGVETRQRLQSLRANPQVDYVQGYYVSRPLPIDQFVTFLEGWRPLGRARRAPQAAEVAG